MRINAVVFTLVAAGLLVQPGAVSSQQSTGWSPALAGVRGGWDRNSTGSVVGAQLRIPVLPSGHLELMPNADITFLTGLKEYQYGVDAVLVSGGRRGGIYAGGGYGWRNTYFEDPEERETRRAPTAVVGARSGTLFGAPFGTQIEMRWVFLEGVYKPRVLTLGINFALWGRGNRRSR